MRRQRNIVQMKEQKETPEKELNEMEISNLSHAQFKTLVIRMLQELTGYFNGIKKTQAEMKPALSEIKENLQRTNSGVNEAENQINDLEQKEGKSIQSEQQEEKRIPKTKQNEERLRNLWYIFKHTNIQSIGMPEGEEEEQEIESLFEKVMKENFPNLVKEIDIQVQEEQCPKQDGHKEDHTKPHHKIPKVKDKEIILKAAREKKLVTYRVVPIRLSPDFSKETLWDRRDWQEIFKVMKSRNIRAKIALSGKGSKGR